MDPRDVFEKDVGTWDAEVTVTFPGQPASRSRAVLTARRIAGGRWLVSDFVNRDSGFEGHGVYGWDEGRGAYTGTWVDNQHSALTVGIGTWDPDTRTMTFRYASDGPRAMRWREHTTTVDADTQEFRSIVEAPTGEFQLIHAVYRRRAT